MAKTTIRVRFYNCDPLGIVYFGDYYRFAENAFTDVLHELGVTWEGWQKEQPNVYVPIVASGASYHSPSRFDDLLEVEVKLISISNKSFSILHEINKDSRRVCEVWIKRTLLDKSTMKSIRIPEGIADILKKLPIAENFNKDLSKPQK